MKSDKKGKYSKPSSYQAKLPLDEELKDIIKDTREFNDHLNNGTLKDFGAHDIVVLLTQVLEIYPVRQTPVEALDTLYLGTVENRDKSYIYIAETLTDFGDESLTNLSTKGYGSKFAASLKYYKIAFEIYEKIGSYNLALKHLNYIEYNLQESAKQHKIGSYSAKEDIVSYLFIDEYEKNRPEGSYDSSQVMVHVENIFSNIANPIELL